MKKTVAVSLLGTQLDFVGKRGNRWARWRPNVSLCSQEDLQINELYLLHDERHSRLANQITEDIYSVSPDTKVILETTHFIDPWDFGEVYAKLFDWCKEQSFDPEQQDLLFHITTGTHVVQICSYLLTESRHFPGRLIQSSPDRDAASPSVGQVQIIDLDLSKYDQLANRFDIEHQEGSAFLKGGINTQNAAFNRLISEIEKVAIRSCEPILLTGATGAGKSQLASRIFQLKKRRAMVKGEFVAVNCATLRGENAMAALFGHTKGAFTGALKARDGFLLTAHHGVLFLDEVGELGLEEQAMLLHAIENKQFYPVGSDKALCSDFQLIAGTNRDLKQMVAQGQFREDLLARINLWHYQLPALRDRREDIPANVEFELTRFMEKNNHRVQFNKEAKTAFLRFAQSPEALWLGNFRDLGAAITRLCTLADQSRIALDDVHAEIERLKASWTAPRESSLVLADHLADPSQLDNFDQQQLNYVLSVCQSANTLASAGRELFNVSRLSKSSSNDSSRLQKYLAKFGLAWKDIKRQ
uniref:RNA repair transcriptional activator RtcR n=1 Tax=Thaumasiovibrio occultus TaxID=1891184 RepID=UPI000B355B3F|nr:RNA repair transcriptional activator RtcR [Thaumasiovibrio occultus]